MRPVNQRVGDEPAGLHGHADAFGDDRVCFARRIAHQEYAAIHTADASIPWHGSCCTDCAINCPFQS